MLLDEMIELAIVWSLFSFGAWTATMKEKMVFRPITLRIDRLVYRRGNALRAELEDPNLTTIEEKLWMMFSCPVCCVTGWGLVLFGLNSLVAEPLDIYVVSGVLNHPPLLIIGWVMAAAINHVLAKITDND